MRRNESRVGQVARPSLSQADEIVPIRAIAVEKNHKLFRRAARRRLKARAIDFNCHFNTSGDSNKLSQYSEKLIC